MVEKLIIDKELYEELKVMMKSSSEDDVVMAISIIENSDEWNVQNQVYKEKLYETLRFENGHIQNKGELKMRVWLGQIDLDQ